MLVRAVAAKPRLVSFRTLVRRRQLHRLATRTIGRRAMDTFTWKRRAVFAQKARPMPGWTGNRFQIPKQTYSRALVPTRSMMGNVGNVRRTRTTNVRQIVRRRRGQTAPSKQFRSDAGVWQSMGMRLTDKLRPNPQRTDIFNKDYRAHIVRTYILNGVSTTTSEIEFPQRMTPMFAISIRPTRFENLRTRLGPWEKHLRHWQGTLGMVLDKNKMVNDGLVVARLTRGEIGCYDSHYRLWKHMVDSNIQSAFILEDDADINYGHMAVDRIHQMFEEIQKNNVAWDVIYLGHNNNKPPRRRIGACLGTPAGVQGLFMYLISLEGAKKLIANAMPMTQPVDDYMFASQDRVRQFTLEPRLGWVVKIEQSDTANIK